MCEDNKMSNIAKLKLSRPEAKHIAKTIRSLIQKNQLTESELARSLNIPIMTVRRIVSGETADPRISTLQLFADFFNVSLDFLTQEKTLGNQNPTQTLLRPDFVPLFTWQELEMIENINEIDTLTWEHWHPITMPGIENTVHCFALQSKPTMQPRFPHGTILLIDQKEPYQDGDLVLVRMDDNKLSLREMIFDGPSKILQPVIQGSAATPYLAKSHQIIGIVMLTLMYPRKK